MQSVRTKDTGPELVVRQLLYRAGYRYRLHRKQLSGKPDLVFASKHKVIFVHGCFWHGHNCRKGKLPKSRLEYWKPKISLNKKRDSKNRHQLKQGGWETLVVWQCELRNTDAI